MDNFKYICFVTIAQDGKETTVQIFYIMWTIFIEIKKIPKTIQHNVE